MKIVSEQRCAERTLRFGDGGAAFGAELAWDVGAEVVGAGEAGPGPCGSPERGPIAAEGGEGDGGPPVFVTDAEMGFNRGIERVPAGLIFVTGAILRIVDGAEAKANEVVAEEIFFPGGDLFNLGPRDPPDDSAGAILNHANGFVFNLDSMGRPASFAAPGDDSEEQAEWKE